MSTATVDPSMQFLACWMAKPRRECMIVACRTQRRKRHGIGARRASRGEEGVHLILANLLGVSYKCAREDSGRPEARLRIERIFSHTKYIAQFNTEHKYPPSEWRVRFPSAQVKVTVNLHAPELKKIRTCLYVNRHLSSLFLTSCLPGKSKAALLGKSNPAPVDQGGPQWKR
jgi:hypothetical protein